MNTAQLAKVCRCGHERRFHQTGNIFENFQTACHHLHTGDNRDEYGIGCFYFEEADGWQESYAEALRSEGYIVDRPIRDEHGRFVRKPVPA